MYDEYLADELREKIDLSNFELDTCEEIDDTCVITGVTDDGVRECRTYSINKQENFRDCWDYVRERHYTETIGYVFDFELIHTEILASPEDK